MMFFIGIGKKGRSGKKAYYGDISNAQGDQLTGELLTSTTRSSSTLCIPIHRFSAGCSSLSSHERHHPYLPKQARVDGSFSCIAILSMKPPVLRQPGARSAFGLLPQKKLRRGRNRGGARVAWVTRKSGIRSQLNHEISVVDDDRQGRQGREVPRHPEREPKWHQFAFQVLPSASLPWRLTWPIRSRKLPVPPATVN